jgi:copper resistance protein D
MIAIEVFVRFLHFVAALLLLGSFSFTLLVARPAVKKTSEASSSLLALSQTQLLIARWALLLAIVSAFAALAVKIDTATGRSWSAFYDADALTAVLTETRFGIVWMARMLIACLPTVMLLLHLRGWVRTDSLVLRITGVILSGLFLVGLAFAGHATAAEDVTFVVQVLADALHLLAGGVWLGGLLPLILLLYWIRKTDVPTTLSIAQDTTRRFSLIASQIFACV